MARAVKKSLLSAVAQSVAMTCGTMFDATEITPFAPSASMGSVWSSFPLQMFSASPQRYLVRETREMSPEASFTPLMRGISARRA